MARQYDRLIFELSSEGRIAYSLPESGSKLRLERLT